MNRDLVPSLSIFGPAPRRARPRQLLTVALLTLAAMAASCTGSTVVSQIKVDPEVTMVRKEVLLSVEVAGGNPSNLTADWSLGTGHGTLLDEAGDPWVRKYRPRSSGHEKVTLRVLDSGGREIFKREKILRVEAPPAPLPPSPSPSASRAPGPKGPSQTTGAPAGISLETPRLVLGKTTAGTEDPGAREYRWQDPEVERWWALGIGAQDKQLPLVGRVKPGHRVKVSIHLHYVPGQKDFPQPAPQVADDGAFDGVVYLREGEKDRRKRLDIRVVDASDGPVGEFSLWLVP